MPVKYKIDIMQALRNAGYSRTALRRSKTLPEGMMTKLCTGNTSLTINAVARLCALLNCQPGDLLEYVPDDLQGDTSEQEQQHQHNNP